MKVFLTLLFCHFTIYPAKAEERNAVIVCENSLETVQWDLEFIRNASRSIEFAPCFFGGKIAREFLAAIESRLEACTDLQVNILASPLFLEKEDCAYIERLKKAYPDNFRIAITTMYLSLWPDMTGIDNHVKMCIVDEQYFSMGGTNFDTSHCSDGTFTPEKGVDKECELGKYLPAGTRDQDIVGRGPAAKRLRRTFCKLFALWNVFNQTHYFEKNADLYEENPFYFEILEKPFIASFEQSEKMILLEEDQIDYFFSGPHQAPNLITEEYARLIHEAKSEITIANLYLNPADAVFQALLDAVNRGVKLTIITNGLNESSPACNFSFAWANRLSYVPLFFGDNFSFWEYWQVKEKTPKNTQIYEYQVKDVLLHKKIMIIDREISVIGSYNLGQKSHIADYENIVILRSPEVARVFEQINRIDKLHSREVTHDMAIEWYFDPAISYIDTL